MLVDHRQVPSVILMPEGNVQLFVTSVHNLVTNFFGGCASKMQQDCTFGGGYGHTQSMQNPQSLRDRLNLLLQLMTRVDHSLKERIISEPVTMLFAPFRPHLVHNEHSK